MKSKLTLAVLLLSLTALSHRAHAQWDLLSDLLGQDAGTNGFFFDNLDSLNENWNPNLNVGNDLFNILNNNLLDSVPPGNLDSSYLDALGSGFDSLVNHLPGYGLDPNDENVLLDELDWIGEIFGNNFDSLGGLFGLYHDSLSFDSSNWEVNILGFDSLSNEHYLILEDSVNNLDIPINPNGPGDFQNIADKLFDINLFPDLELAFGVLDANLKYFDYRYGASAKVARIGSVPRFDRDVFNCNGNLPRFPIEARWHVMVSWTEKLVGQLPYNDLVNGNTDNGSTTGSGSSADPSDKAFNPLLFSGDYALMATPSIGVYGKTSFRLITSVGTEFGTYAPSHSEYAKPYTSANKGYMTGLGAQAGAGFSFTTGQLTVYNIATFAQGQALRCPKPYPYTSRRYEVGMRYGKFINLRYSTGFTSWQAETNRQADVKNQFTVGIILQELHR
jgi:hypothetical protein